jgi:hypothetical protein
MCERTLVFAFSCLGYLCQRPALTWKSYTMCERMSLSVTKPRARKTITTGMSSRMCGIVALIVPAR